MRCHDNHDMLFPVRPKKRSMCTRPFSLFGVGSGDETKFFQDKHAEGGSRKLPIPFWIQILQRLRNVTHSLRRACADTMPSASQLIFILPFMRAVDLLYDRISICKVPRASEFVEQSWSGCSNIQIRDVTRILQSDWPIKISAYGSKMVKAVSQTLPPRGLSWKNWMLWRERPAFETTPPPQIVANLVEPDCVRVWLHGTILCWGGVEE